MADPTGKGETWEKARRLGLKYPLLTLADLGRLLGVDRRRINQCLLDLKGERERLRTKELERIRKTEEL
jgi:hypothetical protein